MSEERAVLAGGCFWGMQDLIRRYAGVISTRVGYTGGEVANATYRNHGNHAEAIEIIFDPAKISYRRLLEFFFQIHDPTTPNRQGNDRGPSYRSAIYYTSDEQKRVAEDTIADVEASGLWPGKVVTEVAPAGPFWQAEPEHQDYLERIPNGYTCHFIRPDWKLPVRKDTRGAVDRRGVTEAACRRIRLARNAPACRCLPEPAAGHIIWGDLAPIRPKPSSLVPIMFSCFDRCSPPVPSHARHALPHFARCHPGQRKGLGLLPESAAMARGWMPGSSPAPSAATCPWRRSLAACAAPAAAIARPWRWSTRRPRRCASRADEGQGTPCAISIP